MNPYPETRIPVLFQRTSTLLSMFIVVLSTSILFNWFFEFYQTEELSFMSLNMKENSAICFLYVGVVLFLLRYKETDLKLFVEVLRKCVGVFVASIGILSLLRAQYGISAVLDRIFIFVEGSNAGAMNNGGMATLTSICFILLGISLFMYDKRIRSYYPYQYLALSIGALAGIPFMEYLFEADKGTSMIGSDRMTFVSSVSFILIMLALLYSNPRKGIMNIVSGKTLGGMFLRKVFPLSILSIALIEWLNDFLIEENFYSHASGEVLEMIFLLSMFTILLWTSAILITRYEKKLVRSETNMRAIFDNTLIGFILLRPDFHIISLNEQCVKFFQMAFGRRIEAGENFVNILPSYRHEEIRSSLSKVLKGETVRYEVCYPTVNSESLWLDVSIIPVYDVSKEVKAISFAINDVSHKKNAQEEIRASEEKFRNLTLTAHDAIISTDSEGCIVSWNNGAARTFGYEEEQILHHPLSEIIPGGDMVQILGMVNASQETNHPGVGVQQEASGLSKTGKCIPLELSMSTWKTRKGQFYTAIMRDISIRKQRETELLQLHKAIDSASEVIFLTDKNGIITFMNSAFTSTYGFEAKEVIGTCTPRILNSGKIPREKITAFWEKLLSGNDARAEYQNKRKDGSLIDIMGSASPIFDDQQNILGFVGIHYDITERKQGMEQLLARNEMLHQIAFMQSHQVRAPIASILGLINLFRFDEPSDPINAEVLAHLESATKSFDLVIGQIVKKTNEIAKMEEVINKDGSPIESTYNPAMPKLDIHPFFYGKYKSARLQAHYEYQRGNQQGNSAFPMNVVNASHSTKDLRQDPIENMYVIRKKTGS